MRNFVNERTIIMKKCITGINKDVVAVAPESAAGRCANKATGINKIKTKVINKLAAIRRLTMTAAMAITAAFSYSRAAFAFGESVTITADSTTDASSLMGNIIGILLTITRFVGVALVVYGVYEIVMSFMQNQPEAKTKGIVMALAGVVMVALKSVLSGLGIIA